MNDLKYCSEFRKESITPIDIFLMRFLHRYVLLAFVFYFVSFFSVFGQVATVFGDDFDDGIIPSRYTPFGGATINEVNGKLQLTLPAVGSGLEINTEDLDNMACVAINYAIDQDLFPIGTAVKFSWNSESISIPNLEFEAFSITTRRPFWNKCKYTITQGDNGGGIIGFTGPYKNDIPCPGIKKISLDWLPPDENGNKRFMIEIDDTVNGERVFLKRAIRVEGVDYGTEGVGNTPGFSHEDNQIKNIKITKNGPMPLVVEIDKLTIDSTHQGPGVPAVTLTPKCLNPGDLLNVDIETPEPYFIPNETILDMGAEVLIHSFEIISPTLATANIQVDDRARNGGHYINVINDDFDLSADFTIKPIEFTEPLPENIEPEHNITAPTLIPPETPFTINSFWQDIDDEFIQGLIVIMENESTEEVFSSGNFFLNTNGGIPITLETEVSGLPLGSYKIVSIANDGLAPEEVREFQFTIAEPIPTLSEWGLIILSLLLLSLGVVAILRRQNSLVLAGNFQTVDNFPSFTKGEYTKALLISLTLGVAGIGIASWWFGEVSMTDQIGTILCCTIVAYIIHFGFRK